MSISREQMIAKRDKKVRATFLDLAPVWLVNDEYRSRQDGFFFNVVYHNPVHSWISQRFKYDLFNNVLYHLGEKRVSEEALLQIQERAPYLPGSGAASIPNNPANRL